MKRSNVSAGTSAVISMLMLLLEDGTFASAGKVGLWTKADSVVYFDDFEASGQ